MDKQIDIYSKYLFTLEVKASKQYENYKYYCKCGHSVIISPRKNKVLCNWCGHWVFKSEREEFKYRIGELMK